MPRERSAFWTRRPLRFEALEDRRLLSVFSLDTDADLPGVASSSVAWGDYDNDGDLDILLTGDTGSGKISRVYRNDDGTFTEIDAGLPGVRFGSVAWGDYDNDGDLDILLTGNGDGYSRISRVYRNDGRTFNDAGAEMPGVSCGSVAWGDYDNDGDLDILLTGEIRSSKISRVYRNDGGTFTDISAGLPGVHWSSAAWGDYDNDGDLDILLTGHTGSSRISRVYRNDGGTFTDISAGLPGVYHSSVAWGDCDNDGDLDILLTGDFGSSKISRVYRNDRGTFADISAGLPGVRYSSVAWGDYDNDGDLDILLTGYADGGLWTSRVYNNDGGMFTDVSAALWEVYRSSVAWGDYNNDGNLDILLTGSYISRVYRNDGATFNQAPSAPTDLAATFTDSTSVTLSWTAPADNPPTPGGTPTPSAGLSYNLRVGTTPGAADVVGPMSFDGTSTPPDGLRKLAQRGPIQGTSWTLTDLTPGATYYWSVQAVDTALAGSPFATEGSFTTPSFTDIEAGLPDVSWGSVAWGDYDNDGDLDILLTGEASDGHTSRVYRNDGETFTDISAGLPGISGSVAWGDYDNDGDLDILLMGSYAFRLYRNDGGTFSDAGAGVPGVRSGSVAWGDYDNDGDLDILLTGYELVRNPFSRVYRNDGGSFTDAGAGLPAVADSSVAWGDYDKDGDLDILLTGETDQDERISRVFRNDDGTFNDIDAGLPGVSESSVAWGDYDNDGDLDILLTGYEGPGLISRVYRNDGGTFTDIDAGLTGVWLNSVAWGDYDNDGDLDILLMGKSYVGPISRVYRNDSGTFTDISAGLPGVRHGSVAWGDYDNDGDLDILLTGRGESHHISRVYRNDGPTFNQAPSSPTGLAAVVNGLASATLSWTAPADNPPSPGGMPTPSAGLSYNLRVGTTPGAGDVVGPMSFDGTTTPPDGLRKVAQRGLIQGTSWTLTDLTPGTSYYWSVQAVDTALAGGPFATEGSFTIPADFGDAPGPYPTLLADGGPSHVPIGPTLGAARDSETNGQPSAAADGDDLVASDDEDGVTFRSVVMAGQLDASLTVNVQNAPEDAKLDAWIDFNADGCWGGPGEQIADAVAVIEGDNVVRFDVPGWAASGATYARFRLSTAGDLAPTGYAADGEVEDYRVSIAPPAVASGLFGGQNVITTAGGAGSVFAADVDGDGDMDVLSAALHDDTIAWHENDGSGDFINTHTITDAADGPIAVCAADVDGDGDLDLLAASYHGNTVAWYKNDGSGSFAAARPIDEAANGARSVSAADVDGDGDLDVLAALTASNKITWYENTNGHGRFSAAKPVDDDANGAQWVFAADVNRDGHLDVLSASSTDNTIAWYENDGSGSFTTKHIITTGAMEAHSVFAADLDSDGDVDVLSASGGDNRIAWYENEGGGFTTHDITGTASEAHFASAADVDGDGDLDVLSASYGDDTIAWYENDGSGNFAAMPPITTAANGAIALFAADVDGDGRMDVLSASVVDGKIAWYENLPIAPWAIDFLDVHLGVLSPGRYQYSLQATHDGMLTVEAVAGGTVLLTLHDPWLNRWEFAIQRVDYTATAGKTYSISFVNTVTQDVRLRLCNLVEHEGTTVTVHGTEGDDTFSFDASASRTVTINDVQYDFDAAEVTSVSFDGTTGQDTAILTGSADDETAILYPTRATWTGPVEVSVANSTQITIHSGGGSDTAKLYDSPGDDMLIVTPDEASMTGPGYSNQVVGFGYAMGIAREDGYDTAKLEDSPGEDTFLGTHTYSKMSTGGETYAYAKSFEHVIGYSRTGSDTAILKDSPGDDKFVGRSTYGKLSGPGFKVQAQWFGAVEAYAWYGGDDRAYLFDSPGDDWFIGTPVDVRMVGSGFRNYAKRFESAYGYGTAGGLDRAIFYDSPGNDTFVGTATKGRLTGPGYYLQAVRCDVVRAFSQSGGQDKARLFDSAGDDVLIATPEYSYLRGSPSTGNFKNRADGFAEVESTARFGGDDTARLYDSALNDYLHAEGNSAVMTWDAARILAAYDFDQVEADGSPGGVNLLRKVLPIDYALLTTGNWTEL